MTVTSPTSALIVQIKVILNAGMEVVPENGTPLWLQNGPRECGADVPASNKSLKDLRVGDKVAWPALGLFLEDLNGRDPAGFL